MTNPMGVKWHLTVIFICISLISSDVEHLPCVYRLFVTLIWRNAYSSYLSVS